MKIRSGEWWLEMTLMFCQWHWYSKTTMVLAKDGGVYQWGWCLLIAVILVCDNDLTNDGDICKEQKWVEMTALPIF